MSGTPLNPLPVAFFAFTPAAPAALKRGSWGVISITPTIPSQAFDVILSPQFAGALSVVDSADLQIVPTVHEAGTGLTITPLAGGFSIDFGAPLTRQVTIEVKKLIGE